MCVGGPHGIVQQRQRNHRTSEAHTEFLTQTANRRVTRNGKKTEPYSVDIEKE